MLLGSVSVIAVSAEGEYDHLPFTDLNHNAWYMESIGFCYDMGLVNGMTATTFKPNSTLTRAQFVQILAQLDDGYDPADYENETSGFNDVKPSHWYNAAVNWAVTWGYVSGMSPTRFGPNEPITREQMVRLLFLYASSQTFILNGDDGSMDIRDDLSAFDDAGKVSDWALEGMQWAVAAGIISGMNETTLAPRATATRAQVCSMFMSYWEFVYYGLMDRSGAYAAMADYIKANGSTGENLTGDYEINTVLENGAILSAGYTEGDGLSFAYLNEPYETSFYGDPIDSYREIAVLFISSLEPYYGLSYLYGDTENIDAGFVVTTGILGKDGYTEMLCEAEVYNIEDFRDRIDNAANSVIELLYEILSKTEFTTEDLFKSNKDTTGAFAAIADYAADKAGKADYFGSYVYTKEDDDRYWSVSYNYIDEVITISYGLKEEEEFGGFSFTDYATIYIDGLASEYEYYFDYWSETEEYGYYSVIAALGAEVYDKDEVDSMIEDPEELAAAEAFDLECREALVSFIESLLAECGLEYTDLFKV